MITEYAGIKIGHKTLGELIDYVDTNRIRATFVVGGTMVDGYVHSNTPGELLVVTDSDTTNDSAEDWAGTVTHLDRTSITSISIDADNENEAEDAPEDEGESEGATETETEEGVREPSNFLKRLFHGS